MTEELEKGELPSETEECSKMDDGEKEEGMEASTENALWFEGKSEVPDGADMYPTEDGTVYYLVDWKRLYVKWQDIDVEAELPEGNIQGISVHGNAIFIEHQKKFYKVKFTLKDGMEVKYLRDKNWDECRMPYGGIYTRRIDDVKYAYGMWDEPERDGHIIDTTIDDSYVLSSIHRGRVIYTKHSFEAPVVHKLNEYTIVIEGPFQGPLYTRESSPLAHFIDGDTIYTVNTETMEVLPALKLRGGKFMVDVIHIINGEITLMPAWSNYLMTAKLPEGYFIESAAPQSAPREVKKSTLKVETSDNEVIVNEEEVERCDLVVENRELKRQNEKLLASLKKKEEEARTANERCAEIAAEKAMLAQRILEGIESLTKAEQPIVNVIMQMQYAVAAATGEAAAVAYAAAQ